MKKWTSTWNVTDSIFIIKSGFPYVSAQRFNEGETNMRNYITTMAYQIKRITRGKGEIFPCHFSKIGKKCPDFGKIYPGCSHPGFKFII